MSFKKYSNYKSSGCDWLGDVPQHWDLKRLSHYFEERREKVSDLEYEPLSVTKHGVVPRLETAAKTQDGDNRKKVLKGDFVINSRSDRKGSSGLSSQDGSVSLICTVLKPFGIHGAYVHHLFRSEAFQEEYYRWGKGIVADLWSTNFSDMKNIVLGLPSESEQTQIARFLDHETAKIDALIEQQQRLIELLKEKRQAVISQAVTKGLDPDVPMKDSGVEWLGEVPAHWEIKRLKHLCLAIKAGPFGSALTKDMYVISGYKVYGQEQVIPSDFDIGDYYISEEYFQCLQQYEVKPDDILISCVGTFGKVAVAPQSVEPGIINPRLIRVRVNQLVDANFLASVLRSAVVFEQFSLLSRGGTMDVINISTLSSINLAVPPVDEQIEILEFIRRTELRLDGLIHQATKGVDLLKERRSALISAAVTGKIDVRSWQPPASESQQEQQQERAHG